MTGHGHGRGQWGRGYGSGFGGGRGFGPPRGRRRRGDVRAAILRLLADRPMHGYEMIQELETRSEGEWRPSAGSIYPALQLLEDQGLVKSAEVDGKRVFELTDAGREELPAEPDAPAPWEQAAESGQRPDRQLAHAAYQVAAATHQVINSGSAEQVERAQELLAETRRKLYALLAED